MGWLNDNEIDKQKFKVGKPIKDGEIDGNR